MKPTDKKSQTIVQMNDTHAYFDIHQEITDAMRNYPGKYRPMRAELRGTFIPVYEDMVKIVLL